MASKHGAGRPGVGRAALISALFIILVIGLLAAGCGGTSATTTTAGSTPTTAGVSTTGGVTTTAGVSTTTGGAGGAQVVMKNFAFAPASVTIKAGDSVTWTNQDGTTHTVNGDNGEFTSGNIASGATFTFKFDKAGTYSYHCSIHPTMKATVVVQ